MMKRKWVEHAGGFAKSAAVLACGLLLFTGCSTDMGDLGGDDPSPDRCVDARVLKELRRGTDPAETEAIALLNSGRKPFGCVTEQTLTDLLDTAGTTGGDVPLLRFNVDGS